MSDQPDLAPESIEAAPEPIEVALPALTAPPSPRRAGLLDLALGVPLIWLTVIVTQGLLLAIFGASISPTMIVLGGVADGIFTTSVAWAFVCLRHGRGFFDGFRITWPGARVALLSLGVGIGGAAAATLLTARYSTGESLLSELASTPEGLLAVSFVAVTLPVVEELYYRGFIFPVLKDLGLRHLPGRLGPWLAVAVVALWFGAVHVPQLVKDPIGIPVVATMGLIWTIMRLKTDSLTPSLLSHWSYNASLVTISWLTLEP